MIAHHAFDPPERLLPRTKAAARAWERKETFSPFWTYRSLVCAEAFLDYWCARARRSRLEPMKRVARMLRAGEEVLRNWFQAKAEISAGTGEGLNNKIRVVSRRSCGFRAYEAMGNAPFRSLGRFPELESARSSC